MKNNNNKNVTARVTTEQVGCFVWLCCNLHLIWQFTHQNGFNEILARASFEPCLAEANVRLFGRKGALLVADSCTRF